MANLGRAAILLVVVGCTSRDAEPTDPSWQLVTQDETAALLGVWGSSADDVWVVGGRTALDGDPAVLHYENGWSRVATGLPGVDLWWAFGLGADDVYFAGSNGTIVRRHAGQLAPMVTPRTGTIFGLWGTSASDLWAVGDGGADGGIVWHYDGAQWTEVVLPEGTPSRIFKVDGRASDDVWIACGDGSVLHWQGASLERQVPAVDTPAPLFSIVTTAADVVAVGGAVGNGQILEHGSEWTPSSLEAPVVWRGATARADVVYALGEQGAVARRDATGWHAVPQPLTQESFHAGWIDPDGALWAVGGAFNQTPLTGDGFVVRYARGSVAEVEL